jgi:Flp pilus assembly protein TadD
MAPMFARSLAAALLLAPVLAAGQTLPESYERCRYAEEPQVGIAACKEALQSQGLLQAERARTWVTLGGYQRRAGDFAAALTSLDQAAKIAPNAPGIPVERAIVLHQSGDLAGAMKAHERAFTLGSGSPAMFNNRAITKLALGQTEAAIADLDAALALIAENGAVLDNRATAKCRAGDVDGSIADRLEMLELREADAGALDAAMAAAGFEVGSGAENRAEALKRWTTAGCPGAPEPRFL